MPMCRRWAAIAGIRRACCADSTSPEPGPQPRGCRMICPKCQYQRTVSDTAPDWQCPACGIAYTKATPAVSAAAAKPDASPATNAPAVKKRLLTLAMWLQLDAAIALAAGGFYFRGHFDYPYREYPWILLAIAAWAIPSILVVRVIFTAYMRSAA